VVVILTTFILAVLLRSLVAPLYLVIAVLLNFFATVGAACFLFVNIQGDDGRAYAVPLYAFIFLVSLGADYTIFLMTRIREEAQEYGLEEGTIRALSKTGGVITSAGLILAGTFLVLTILPIRELYQLGVIVALGVILDTFVVRGVVVPATVLLFKKLNWWPSKMAWDKAETPFGKSRS
jgi:RND superfamily putative drug exporter